MKKILWHGFNPWFQNSKKPDLWKPGPSLLCVPILILLPPLTSIRPTDRIFGRILFGIRSTTNITYAADNKACRYALNDDELSIKAQCSFNWQTEYSSMTNRIFGRTFGIIRSTTKLFYLRSWRQSLSIRSEWWRTINQSTMFFQCFSYTFTPFQSSYWSRIQGR